MPIQLGSELNEFRKHCCSSLTPMSFNLGSELLHRSFAELLRLTPMSFNLGSEPLFSNLYLIVT